MQKNRILTIVLASLIPLLALLGLLLFGGLNLGVDYASSNVVSFKLTEEKNVDEVSSKIKELSNFDRIDAFSDGKYQVYYQNVSLEELSELEDDYTEKLGDISEFQVLVYNPTTLILIGGRILYGLYALTIIYLIFLAYLLKGSGISRVNLIRLLVGDVLLFAMLVLTTIGIVNSIGFLGLNINAQTVNYSLTIFLYALFLNIIISRNLKLSITSKLSNEWIDAINSLKMGEIKYYVVIGATLIAFLAIRVDLLLLIIALAFVLLYSMLLHIFLKPILMDWLITGGKNFKLISKNKRLSKEW
ncbi:MAG TPA: hypothetical protein PK863_01215 [Candidatus Dojkabacteria bacterium]|nr:hypothetical protein [Candidatus Dojkabacteria bacterium]HRP50918.1 hypothetical protein [Candidatus Dojkabacteria bacterium]